MKPDDANLIDWQELVNEYRKQNNPIYPLAMRMENSQLSVAKHYGGFSMNGHEYLVIYPWKTMRIADGKAMLGVELKFHTWACGRLKKAKKILIHNETQSELNLV